MLNQIVSELRAGYPDRTIQTRFSLTRPVSCDRTRIAQLFSNLLGNALTHGAADKPVFVQASTRNNIFVLSVTNEGDVIPAAAMAQLFHPFARGAVGVGQQGLGLGLYIASEIARAHHGKIDVSSTPEETCFTFQMPLSEDC